jgi:branched-chain amino acid transport system permease protein
LIWKMRWKMNRETQRGAKQVSSSTIATALALSLPHDRWKAEEVVFWLLPLAAFFLFPDYLILGSQILIAGLFAVSLDLILGYAGILSLGHAAFFGIGAYTAGLLAVHGWDEPLSGLAVAAIVAAGCGFLISFLVVRGQDLTRLMVTLGIGIVLYELANREADITGGVDGLSGVSMGKIFGEFEFDLNGHTAYVYCLAVLFVLFAVLRRLVHSPFGLSLSGIREQAKRMPALGANVSRRLVAVFTLGAAVAGVAGALLAQTTQFVGMETLSFSRSAELLIMLVLGGTGRLYGGLVGAALFMLMQDYLSGLNPLYWQFWIGLLLVLIVLCARGGVLGGLARLRTVIARRAASAYGGLS